jgi:hypothetical protein
MSDEDFDDDDLSGIGHPDWDRALVDAGKKGLPLGDPTKWGSQVPTVLPLTLVEQFSDQIIMAQTRDAYARSWAVIGTLTLPQATWNAAGAFPAGPFPLIVALEIIMGVGQASVKHDIILTCGTNATVGLCNTQNAINGGPYLSTFGGPPNFDESRPFAAIGALIGNTITARARYIGGTNVGLPTTSILTAIVTPFAPGVGL